MFTVQAIDQGATSGRSRSRKWPKPNHGIGAPTSWTTLHGDLLTHFQWKITKRTSQSQGWPRNLFLEPIGRLCEGSIRMISNFTIGHKIPDELVFQFRWKYAIGISRFGDITFVLKTGAQPAERTRPDRKGIGFARPSPGPTRTTTPFDPGSITPRSNQDLPHVPCSQPSAAIDPGSNEPRSTHSSTCDQSIRPNAPVEQEGKGPRSTQIITSRPRPLHHGRPRRPTTSLTRSTRSPRTRSPLMQGFHHAAAPKTAHRPIEELSSHDRPAQKITSVPRSARPSAHINPGTFRPWSIHSSPTTMFRAQLRRANQKASFRVRSARLPQSLYRIDVSQVLPNSLDLCKCTDRGSMGIEHKD
ncbi:unnamed protein product [Microthlaspi erraticum]|uniref:Uncharacterized protein n=1 Tax=Microthlaspi erraticum TaxID=1685480 RepID=A0A6D2JD39_9BRAS|nr:unnamed protein product [Microthlaspi erraticum]